MQGTGLFSRKSNVTALHFLSKKFPILFYVKFL